MASNLPEQTAQTQPAAALPAQKTASESIANPPVAPAPTLPAAFEFPPATKLAVLKNVQKEASKNIRIAEEQKSASSDEAREAQLLEELSKTS